MLRTRTLLRLAAIAAVLVTAVAAGNAQAQTANGSITISNQRANTVTKVSPIGTGASALPGSVAAFSSQTASFPFTSGSVIVGQADYRENNGAGLGCSFRWTTSISGGVCSVGLTASPIGSGGGGQQATCLKTLNSVNTSTCAFSATFTLQ